MKLNLEQKERQARVDAIYKLNLHGCFTYVSKGFGQFFNQTPSQLKGVYFTELVHPLYRKEVEQFYAEQLASKKTSTYLEFPIIPINKKSRWVGQTVELVMENGRITEIIAVAKDISALHKTERDLARSQLRIEALVQHMNAAILVEDEYRTIMYVNANFCQLFNIPVPPQDLQGADCSQSAEQSKHLFASPTQFTQGVEAILQRRDPVSNERITMANGKILERDYLPIFFNNQFIGQMWQYREVTEKAHTEQRIKESEEKYRRIIENINLGLLQVDVKQVITYANASFTHITGYTQQELLGKRADKLLLYDEHNPKIEAVNKKRIKGNSSAYEVKVKHKNGQPVWFIISGTPLYNKEGKVIGSLGIHNDITERKKRELERKELLQELNEQNKNLKIRQRDLRAALHQVSTAEAALRQNEKRLENILLSAMDAVVTINQSGDVIMWNDMARQIFGYTSKEASGKNLAQLIIPAEHHNAHHKGMERFLSTGEGPLLNKRIETFGHHKQGHILPLELSITPVQSSSDYIFTAFIRDISQRKNAEDEMRNALEEQKKLSRLRSRLISMTSHELRTPLTTIKTNLELLRFFFDQPETGNLQKAKQQLNRMDGQIERLQNIMNNILLVGKEGAGEMNCKPTATDLVSFGLKLLQNNFQPAPDGRRVELNYQGSPRLVNMDENLMHHVFSNLIGNALKYSPGAPPPVWHIIFESHKVIFQIEDYGIGIPEKEQDQIFDAFYRAENSSDFQGTGMGLAIARQFVEMHKGKLTLYSKTNNGTIFQVELST